MNETIEVPAGAKVLSLWQPWASLIALSEKQYETRSWRTSYSGPLVIHAAKKWDAENGAVWCRSPFRVVFEKHGYQPGAMIPVGMTAIDATPLPRGAAICIADLTDCIPVDRIRHELSAQELAFGNYGPGRYAWKLENVRVFALRIPMRGRQGLWGWEQP